MEEIENSVRENGTPEVFALAQILKISAWHKTLESFGPMPYSHAADATMNIPFDSEKEVYTAMFEELTAAIEELTEKAENGVNVMGAYDAVYAGDATKWVKYGNSLMLRLAMRVRFADAELAKKYATQAVNHSIGVMTAKDDAAQMSQGAGMTFRNNIEWLAGNYNEARMGSSIFSYLMGYEDPRLSVYFCRWMVMPLMVLRLSTEKRIKRCRQGMPMRRMISTNLAQSPIFKVELLHIGCVHRKFIFACGSSFSVGRFRQCGFMV